VSDLPGHNSGPGATPSNEEGGVLTTLLCTYIDKRDRGALDAFYRLVSDDDFRKLGLVVKKQGPASAVTVKEVVDEALAKFLEELLSGKRRKAPKSAERHLRWILRQRFLDRRKSARERLPHEDVGRFKEEIIDPQAPQPAEELLAKESEALTDGRLEAALTSLGAKDEKILRLRLAGKQYPEIAKELGIPDANIWVYSSRAVERLLARLVETAPTMASRLRDLKERSEREKKVAWPTRAEIETTVLRLTERVRDVLLRIHFRDESRELVAREYGLEATEALLKRGYDILAGKLKVDFPEAFDRAPE
jgi:RNA polymerase sigma factor (sigma-70 family)